jgi:hypothetical protein
VDVRGNGGGNISQMLVERLRRRLLGPDFDRVSDYTAHIPTLFFTGPNSACSTKHRHPTATSFLTCSARLGLGPLIGKRTWGGVVGITGRGPLLDGGTVFVPEFAAASADGKYVIEGHGADPEHRRGKRTRVRDRRSRPAARARRLQGHESAGSQSPKAAASSARPRRPPKTRANLAQALDLRTRTGKIP